MTRWLLRGRTLPARLLWLAAALTLPDVAAADGPVASQIAGLNQLCRVAIQEGDLEEALRVCRRVSFDIEKLAPGSPAHVASLVNIGDVKRLVENYVDADASYAYAVKLIERTQGKDSVAAAPILERIVEIKLKRGKFIDAEGVLRQAIRLRSKAGKDSKTNDPTITLLMRRLADIQSLSHQFDAAETTYASVIASLAAAGAPLRAEYAVAVQHLAETFEREQKFARAEAEYQRLLGMDAIEPKAGQATPLTMPQRLDRLGFVIEQQGRRDEAVALYQRELGLLQASGHADEAIANLQARIAVLVAAPASGD